MKILFINDYADKIGGAEEYMFSLIEGLREKGHIVKLFTSTIKSKDYAYRTTHISLNNYIRRLFNRTSYQDIKKLLESFTPDIVHIHGIFNELSPSILLALKEYPVVMTIHNNQIINPLPMSVSKDGTFCKSAECNGCMNCVGFKGAIYEYFKRIIHRTLLKNVDVFICPSNYLTHHVRQNGFINVIRIANGIKLLDYSPIKTFSSILYLGRLKREKGVEYLLRAIPEVMKTLPHIELILAGEGGDKNYFIHLINQLRIEKQVKVVGVIENKNVYDYYKNSTLLVVPSICPDNFPTVCIEAMSVGRPIVGTSMGGIPELIDDKQSGYLVPAYNSESIAKKIIELLSNHKLLTKMSEYAHKKSLAYDLNSHVNIIETQYLELISNKKE